MTVIDIGSFRKHISRVVKKVDEKVGTILKLNEKCWRFINRKRLPLNGMVHSLLIHGASIWAEALRVKAYRGNIEISQREELT